MIKSDTPHLAASYKVCNVVCVKILRVLLLAFTTEAKIRDREIMSIAPAT